MRFENEVENENENKNGEEKLLYSMKRTKRVLRSGEGLSVMIM